MPKAVPREPDAGRQMSPDRLRLTVNRNYKTVLYCPISVPERCKRMFARTGPDPAENARSCSKPDRIGPNSGRSRSTPGETCPIRGQTRPKSAKLELNRPPKLCRSQWMLARSRPNMANIEPKLTQVLPMLVRNRVILHRIRPVLDKLGMGSTKLGPAPARYTTIGATSAEIARLRRGISNVWPS